MFFDFETRQDDGQHIAHFLDVQDQTGFETVSSSLECGCWMELIKVPLSSRDDVELNARF